MDEFDFEEEWVAPEPPAPSPPPLVTSIQFRESRFELRKVEKRLRVIDASTGRQVYVPPDFIRVSRRAEFDQLLEDLTAGRREIDAIMDFERNARTVAG